MEAEKGTPKGTNSEVVDSESNILAWSNKNEYLVAQVAFCVGIGTVWRFPSLCYHNGGGTFLVAYVLMLFTLGLPLLFMEMALGKKVRFGVWTKIHPQLWGVGLASSLACFLVCIYYNMFIAWSIFYLSNSFQYPLPWNQCPVLLNSSIPDPECTRVSPSVYFWYWTTLEITGRIEHSGGIVSSLSLCLLAVWLLVILFSLQDMRVKGKMLYFSMVIPFAILFCLFIRTFMLEGSVYGLRHLMTAKVSNITSLMLWKQAAAEVLFNIGLGFGSLIVFSSFAKKSKNCAQDAFIVVFFDLASCLLATQVVFSMLGFQATVSTWECIKWNTWKLLQLIKMGKLPLEAKPPELLKKYATWLYGLNSDLKSKILLYASNCSVEKEFDQYLEGPSLMFVTLTEAITKLPGSPFWSVIFFLMLINLGLSTSMGLIEGILTPLINTFPSLKNSSLIISVIIGCLGFLFGLLFTQRSGLYFLNLFRKFTLSLPLFIIIIFENFGVAWIYGAKRFMHEAWDKRGLKIPIVYEYLLRYVTLLILFSLVIHNLMEMLLEYPTYEAWDKNSGTELKLPYPKWATILGSSLILLIILPILVGLLKCSKKPVIMPLPKDSSPKIPVISFTSSSLTSQDQQAASSRKNSRFSEAQATEAKEEASEPQGQPSLLDP